jgi:hypothetical protein
MPEIRYRRLTRARARRWLLPRISLWLGPDHLLCVESTGYWEDYKRFYFRDIQAIVVQETKRRTVWNAVLTVPMVFCAVGLMTTLTSRNPNFAVDITWAVLSVLFIVPLVLNNVLGPTCATRLQTAVQTEGLSSLCRLRHTRRILERLQPLIATAQGSEIPPQNIPVPPVAAAVASLPSTNPEPAPATESGAGGSNVPPPQGAVPPVMEP